MKSRCISNIPRFAVALTVSLMLAFMPFTVNLEKYRITLERNEAHAIAPVFAGAAAFLTEMATAAGFASTGEFIATIAGMTAVGTGMGIATNAGINYGSDAAQNLNNLVDAADYPAWETLTESEQQSWGTKDDYDSAKFNSLMAAYGMSDAYERYQSAWGSGGAGNFSFSEQETSSLEQIGIIGSNWINGLPNKFEDLKDWFTPDYINEMKAYLGVKESLTFDGSKVDGYPSSLPQYVKFNKGDYLQIEYTRTFKYNMAGTNRDVYWIVVLDGNGDYYYRMFDKDSFTYGSGMTNVNPVKPATNSNPSYSNAKPEEPYYYTYGSGSNGSSLVNCNMEYNYTNGDKSIYGDAARWILYSDQIDNIGEIVPDIVDYPGVTNINNVVNIYFPTGGLDDETTWDDLTTEPDEPVNPDPSDPDLSGIIALLRHIDNDIHNLNIPGEPDLQPLITVVQHIDSDMHKFGFSQTGELKVIDVPVWTTLDNIYTRLGQILSVLNSRNDVADAPDLIGDFDFDELEEKVPDLLETISDLAPFGSILLLSEMYSILANYTQIESPELVFPFDFGGFDDQNHELIIDLSWLDDIKPLINFFCIAMLVIAIANATIRIVEIEAAS